ncbi:hypothetical protein AAG906_012135 [Vitis piasezkii]
MGVFGEALLSAALGSLFDKLGSYDFIKFASEENVDTELKKWEKELQSIWQELNDAEEKQITEDSVKSWLFDLRVLAYDMEDILDEFAYELMRRKPMGAEAEEASTSKKRNVKMGSKIREITSRLQDISARKAGLGLEKVTGAAATSAWQRPPPTTPIAYEPGVYGRDEDKKAVLDLLRKVGPNENSVGVISIVGMGGLGKTTLARLVYNDEMAKKFDLKAWVCVSHVFDVENITKAILNSVESSDASGSLDFQQVQKKLTDELTGKKFLLILDDVWNKNFDNWDRLRAPLSVGAKGSKVIVTTRNRNVALMMGAAENLHELNPLLEDACWSVFEKHAFEHRNMEDHPNLVSIGRKIVGKCGGLPLAAKALGGLLRSKQREEEWERVSNSKIWDFSSTECEILPALRCFAYCAMFRNDYEFDSKTLVLLWMAEGLIQQPNADNRTMEDLGYDNFCELLSRSFFQSSGIDESRFVMHDLICDLARVASGEICFCLVDNLESNRQSTISKETRHLSFIRGKFDVLKKFEAFQEFEHLRTFVALPIHGTLTESYVTSLVCDHLVPKFRQLRVLSLSEYMIFELPDSIGGLKHLRYLNLSSTQIKLLPDSVTNLYNLQTLILSNCKHLTRLPSNIGNLISLRHLHVVGCSLQEMPHQIGKLKKLQTLSDFIVSKREFLGIKELKDLSHLQGEICISKLENVVDVQDTRDANLKAKLNVERLSMIWSKELDGSHDEDTEMEVLLSLKPHTNLKELRIEYYGGRKFPNWMSDPSYSNLVALSLIGCIRCISVPPVGQLPFLKKLVIKKMDGVQSVGLEFEGQVSLHATPFQCLESLWFEDMKEWEEWCWSTKSFSCLRQLEIKNCPRLIKKLPTHLTSLVKLSIENCPEMMVPLPTDLPSLEELNIYYCPEMMPQFDNHEFLIMPLRGASRSAIDITSHIYLKVSGISGLSRLQPEFMQSLPRLELLETDNSGQLQCLWLDGLGLGNLSRLQILSCDQLVSLGEAEEEEQGLPYNLQHLELRKCDKLEKLPHGLQSYMSLAELIIEDCPKLVSFPEKGFPLMLRGLAISNCESLSSLPDGMMMRNSSNVCHLEYLEIEECPSLICFPKGRLPTTLRRLFISNCENLVSLPEYIHVCALEQLIIERCPSLIGFPKGELPPTLKKLWIWGCEKLESLPEGIMHHHSNNTANCGLQILDISQCSSLASFPTGKFTSTLKSITIDNCAQLQPISEEMFHCNNNELEKLSISRHPNLKTIPDCLYNLKDLRIENITNCENIKVPLSEWGLARLTSLRTLTIGGIFPEATSFSTHHRHLFLLPTTLVELCISSFQNLESLAFLSLQTLTSLRKLDVFQCPKLQSFMPREGLPDMLSELYIRDCPLLIQRCSKEKGEDWPKIAHIPCVKIDDKLILEQ